MRKSAGAILLLAVFLAPQSAASDQEKKPHSKGNAKVAIANEDVIARIQKYREEGERKIVENKFTRKEVELTGDKVKDSIKQKWEKMHAYYEGPKLVRIQLYPRKGVSDRTEEFYLMDGELVFAFIQDQGPKHEGRDAGEPGKELYFHKGKVIKYEDRSGESAADAAQEKRMFETRLPWEVTELLEILKKS